MLSNRKQARHGGVAARFHSNIVVKYLLNANVRHTPPPGGFLSCIHLSFLFNFLKDGSFWEGIAIFAALYLHG
jgi:hypothetical protein